MGEDRVVVRTRCHLYRQVMALRVLEFDHFENEEAFVVFLVRERIGESEQLEMAKRLLIDESAENPRWVIDWVARELEADDREMLADLEARFATATA